MTDLIKTAAEWMRNPSYHGSYNDYVRYMRGMQAYYVEQAENRLVDKIAERLSRADGSVK